MGNIKVQPFPFDKVLHRPSCDCVKAMTQRVCRSDQSRLEQLGFGCVRLQRLVWTGKTPFEIKEMRAKPDGFELEFTQAVDPSTAANVASYTLSSYTYTYQAKYGSDEIQNQSLAVQAATVSEDARQCD